MKLMSFFNATKLGRGEKISQVRGKHDKRGEGDHNKLGEGRKVRLGQDSLPNSHFHSGN
jgi:hypothetical protein